jgi:hypothetical protein
MGRATGQQKGGQPPNPNYGSGAGTDNSNGVYNTSVAQTQGAATGSTPDNSTSGTGLGATGTIAPAAATGTTGAITPTTATGATGAPYGAAYTGAAPNKGQTKGSAGPQPLGTMQQQLAGYNTTAEQALAAGGQPPPAYSTYGPQPVLPTPPTNTTPPQSSPISGTNMNFAPTQKGGAKGGILPAALGSLSTQAQSQAATGQPIPGATGTPGAPTDYAAASGRFNAQNDPTGKYAQMYNQQQAGQAAYDSSPAWMKNMLTGVDQYGDTNQTRAAREQAGGKANEHGGTNTNWQAWVRQQTGEKDAFAAMQKLADVARNSKGGVGQLENMRRSMEAGGIDPNTAARVLEMFHDSGYGADSAARRLGVTDEFLKMKGATQEQRDQAKALADWHKANPTAPPPGATGPPAPGATGATGPAPPPAAPPPAAPPPSGVNPDVDAAAKAQGVPPDRVADIAQKYMVSPQIAAQIYRQLLMQSQGLAGGGDNSGSSGGDE